MTIINKLSKHGESVLMTVAAAMRIANECQSLNEVECQSDICIYIHSHQTWLKLENTHVVEPHNAYRRKLPWMFSALRTLPRHWTQPTPKPTVRIQCWVANKQWVVAQKRSSEWLWKPFAFLCFFLLLCCSCQQAKCFTVKHRFPFMKRQISQFAPSHTNIAAHSRSVDCVFSYLFSLLPIFGMAVFFRVRHGLGSWACKCKQCYALTNLQPYDFEYLKKTNVLCT